MRITGIDTLTGILFGVLDSNTIGWVTSWRLKITSFRADE